MKKIVFIISVCSILYFGCQPSESIEKSEPIPTDIKTIILVRHAEKANDGTEDPPLLPEGELRAEKLAFILKDIPISRVYTTKYQRCSMTIQTVSISKSVQPTQFTVDDLYAFSQEIIKLKDQYILICGHSNTNPALINLLIGEERFEEIPSTEYDGMYWVQIGEGIQPQVTIIRY
jgi:phosphohistidine phosphatase SixA